MPLLDNKKYLRIQMLNQSVVDIASKLNAKTILEERS